MAEALGKKLLGEVEEVGLGEILDELRFANGTGGGQLGIKHVDRFLRTIVEARSSTARSNYAGQPLVELHSLAPGSGSTQLVYYLTATATLPQQFGGQQATVAFIDTDSSYSVKRQARIMQDIVSRHPEPPNHNSEPPNHNSQDVVETALSHVHVFRPQSFLSLTATVQGLPTYFLDGDLHYSLDRRLAFIAIDSASAFYWQKKAESEEAAFLASTGGAARRAGSTPTGYAQLSNILREACKTLNCPAIVTTRQLNAVQSKTRDYQHYGQEQEENSVRPQLPALNPTLRLVVRRLPIRKLPPGIGVEDAAREAENRQKAVGEGKFECSLNQWDLDARTVGKVQRSGGDGFGFRVVEAGVECDD